MRTDTWPSTRRSPLPDGAPGTAMTTEAAPELDLDAVFDYGAYLTHVPEIFERLEALRG